jgi:uncharacterized protein
MKPAIQGDMDRCLALMADDIIWNNIGSTRYSGTYAGKESLVANSAGPTVQPVKGRHCRYTVDNVIADGDFVVVQLRGQAETKKDSRTTILTATCSECATARLSR